MNTEHGRFITLLKWLVLYFAIVLILSLLWIGFANVSESSERYLQELEDLRAQPVPTVTETRTLPPKTLPPKTVEVTVRVTQRAARSAPRVAAPPSSSNATLACIRKHESGGNYQAVSASGTYRGAYQMSVQYSPTWAARAGHQSWAGKPADKWPAAVQDAVAAHMGRSGWGHWSKHTSYHCPGF